MKSLLKFFSYVAACGITAALGFHYMKPQMQAKEQQRFESALAYTYPTEQKISADSVVLKQQPKVDIDGK